MKARKKGTDHPFEEVEYVQLRDSYVITKADMMEFDNDSKNSESDNIDYWEKLRHQAAIAAMQGILSNETLVDDARLDYRITVEKAAVGYADGLIEELKK